MGTGRVDSRGFLAIVATLLAMLAMPSLAAGRAGALDPDFDGDGKVVAFLPQPDRVGSYPGYGLPFEFAPGYVAVAEAPGEKLVVADSQAIVEFGPDGTREQAFGNNGAVQIEQINGVDFQLADVAVDSRGRVLIAGTTGNTDGIGMATDGVGMGGEQAPQGPVPSIGTVRRYLPNGAPDPSFGTGGVVRSYFGAAPATFEGRAYPDPAVSLIGLSVDENDRPVVTGSRVVAVGYCKPITPPLQATEAFVIRLVDDGTADPSFNAGAALAINRLSWLRLPTPTPAHLFGIGASANLCPGTAEPSIIDIGDSGPNSAFGGDGFWSPRPFTRIYDLAVAPGGKIVLLARTAERSHDKWVESAGTAIRLRSDGSLDPSFGHRGEARLELPKRSSIAAIATDRKGNVLLAGTVVRKPRHRSQRYPEFLLMRTTAKGYLDRRFGDHGRVSTGFGRAPNVRASTVLVDQANRIVVGGRFTGPSGGNAFALARYLGGR